MGDSVKFRDTRQDGRIRALEARLPVQTTDIADGSVTSAKILDGTIATVDIAAGAITAPLIAT